MNSKQMSVGCETENIIADIFKHCHYYVYICPKRIGGQPVDIICLKSNQNWLIDAKHVRKEESSFSFSRIEPNQIASLDYALNWADIKNLGFGIMFERDMNIRYLDYQKWLKMAKKGLKSVNMKDLPLLEETINANN